ncbi:MAG: tetratricopeptide repeat protein [Phycisphaerae bacterium]|nr:tetratricopeptide repeat protein [Phycisphaerae bacterium]
MSRQGLARKNIQIVAVLLVSLVAGCGQLTPEARQQLADGAHQYELAKYGEASTTLTRFIDQNADAPEAGEAQYIRGLCELKLRRRTEAQRDFEAAVSKTPRAEVKTRSQAALAVMAYDDGNWDRAIRYYQEAIPWLSDVREYDDHLLRFALCQQRMGNWEQSAHLLARILHEYPKGSAAKTAKYLLGWNRPYFTIQCHALSDAQNAAKEVARLRSLGLLADQQLDTRDGRALYLIQVGKFPTYDEALRELQRIRRTAGLATAKIVP